MKAVWMLLVLWGGARADEADRTRGLLYRMDAEARDVRLHPDQAWGPAQAVQREAGDAAARLDSEGMTRDAAVLRHEAEALARSSREDQAEDVRAHAARLQQVLRKIDDDLPPHDIAH